MQKKEEKKIPATNKEMEKEKIQFRNLCGRETREIYTKEKLCDIGVERELRGLRCTRGTLLKTGNLIIFTVAVHKDIY